MKNLIPFVIAALLIMPTIAAAEAESQNPESMLMDAAASGQSDVIKALLHSGVNIESKNELGATSLTWASQAGHLEVVKLLLDRGANVNVMTTTGITPLMAAAFSGHTDIVEILLRSGADVSAKDKEGNTALKMAEAKGDAQMSALLSSVKKIAGTAPVPVAGQTGQANTEIIRASDSPGGLTVRVEPSPQGQVIAYLPVGSTVGHSGEVSNGWVKLSAPIRGGWVSQSYLGSGNPEGSVVSVDSPEQCLRVRGGPGTDHEKIGCLPQGAKVRLTGTLQNGWAEVVEPMEGWVTLRQIRVPGLFPHAQAASRGQKTRREPAQGAGYGWQQADSDSDFEQVEQGFHEERGQFSRENEGARVFRPPVSPPRGVFRIRPFGIGPGF